MKGSLFLLCLIGIAGVYGADICHDDCTTCYAGGATEYDCMTCDSGTMYNDHDQIPFSGYCLDADLGTAALMPYCPTNTVYFTGKFIILYHTPPIFNLH